MALFQPAYQVAAIEPEELLLALFARQLPEEEDRRLHCSGTPSAKEKLKIKRERTERRSRDLYEIEADMQFGAVQELASRLK